MSESDKQGVTLYGFVSHKLRSLHNGRGVGGGSSRKALSDLRRAVSKSPGAAPIAWQYAIGGDGKVDFPEPNRGHGDKPSPSENGVFTALTLYAVHHQSQTEDPHSESRTFAKAVGVMTRRRSASMKKRFDALMTSQTPRMRNYHARSLVQILRQEGLSFNYARFACDLAKLENSKTRGGVLTRWGRDFSYGYSYYPESDYSSSDQ